MKNGFTAKITTYTYNIKKNIFCLKKFFFHFAGNLELTKKDGVNSTQFLLDTCRADKVAYIDRFDSAFSVQDFNFISRSSVLFKDLDMFSFMEERED